MIRQSIIENWESEGAKIMEVENSSCESDQEDDDSGNQQNHSPTSSSQDKMFKINFRR